MLFLQTIKSHLNPECAVMYREFSAICGSNIQAAVMLSKFVYWSDVVHRTQPERNGWFFKTAKNLFDELGFTRSAYEKARDFLIEKGLLQYRRSGVHGIMHFCVNFERLLEMIYQVKGMAMPKDALKSQLDINNTQIPKWIPLDEWNAFLQVYKEKKGKYPSNRQKSEMYKQLARLRSQFDLKIVMSRSIAAGWLWFYSPEYTPTGSNTPNSHQSAKQVQAINQAIQEQQKQREQQSKPRTEEEIEKARNHLENMKAIINKNKYKKYKR